MFIDGKRVFLAGATGMVGSGIMNYLLGNFPSVQIHAAYYKNTRPFIRDKRVKYIYGDLRSKKDCQKVAKGCDCAVMAAANTSGAGVLTSQPWQQLNDNVIMNSQMLSAFHQQKIKRVVYIGSATLYQECDRPIKENELDFNQDPHPSYLGIGWATRFIEKICKFWHENGGMEIIIVRAANVFGPFARFNPQTSNFIPAIIRKAVDRQDPFEVWGSPKVCRDVIYIEDFARAIVMMLDREQIKFDIFNVGSDTKTTVGEVVSWALKYAGHKPSEVRYLSDKPTTIKFRMLDCAKAKELLGWQPQYAVEEGVKKTLQWWLENRRYWKR